MKGLSDRKVEHLRLIASQPDFSATKYRLVKEIGRGGMGVVYEAEDLQLDRQVAIKILNPADDSAEYGQRMIREARIIARLEHPGIVPVHDVGQLEDGRIFYAMKLVRGSRLDHYVTESHPLSDVLRKFQLVCEAVAFAHAHGVVHRDLKPQNIMIGSFGEVLVLDWGVAKLLREQDSDSEAVTLRRPGIEYRRIEKESQVEETQQGTVIGTRHYMSPEQEKGDVEKLNERSDVYSLGAILYFLITRKSPQPMDDSRQSAEVVTRPRSLDAKISKSTEAVCMKAMSREQQHRYATAQELALEVGRILNAEPVDAYKENVWERLLRWLKKNRFLVLLVLAYLLMRIFFLFARRG